jgi:hypothetical protein
MQTCLSFELPGPPRTVGQHDAEAAIGWIPTDGIQFEEVKESQSDGGGSFKLNLCASVKVSMIVMR